MKINNNLFTDIEYKSFDLQTIQLQPDQAINYNESLKSINYGISTLIIIGIFILSIQVILFTLKIINWYLGKNNSNV